MKYYLIFLITALFSQITFATCPASNDIKISDNNTIIAPPGYSLLIPPADPVNKQDTFYFIYTLLLTSSNEKTATNASITQANCFYSAVDFKNQGQGFTLTKESVPFTTNLNPIIWKFNVNSGQGVYSCDSEQASGCPF